MTVSKGVFGTEGCGGKFGPRTRGIWSRKTAPFHASRIFAWIPLAKMLGSAAEIVWGTKSPPLGDQIPFLQHIYIYIYITACCVAGACILGQPIFGRFGVFLVLWMLWRPRKRERERVNRAEANIEREKGRERERERDVYIYIYIYIYLFIYVYIYICIYAGQLLAGPLDTFPEAGSRPTKI